MPTYEYLCEVCRARSEEVRRIDDRHVPIMCPDCGRRMVLALSVPHAKSWNPDWRFPNLDPGPEKDWMSFDSEAEYQAFLDEKNIREVGGPRATKNHQKEVVRYGDGPAPGEKTPAGTW